MVLLRIKYIIVIVKLALIFLNNQKFMDNNIVFGINPVTELLSKGIRRIDRIYFDNQSRNKALFDLIKQARKMRISYQMVPFNKLNEICGTKKHQGVAVLCSSVELFDIEKVFHIIEQKSKPPLILIPASIEDPRNLGAIIRTCVAFCVDAILLEKKNTAPIGAVVAKSSAGMLEHAVICKPKNLEAVVANFASKGYLVIGAHTQGDLNPHQIDFTKPLIIITGGENRGIPPYLEKLCTHFVKIPINPLVNSLNASVSASILLYECWRQRNFNYS